MAPLLQLLSRNLVNLSVSLTGSSLTVFALLDSGAALNFINERLASSLRQPIQSFSPIQVSLADGRALTHDTAFVNLPFTIASIPHSHTFLLAPICIHSMILGMPWLESVNPDVNWQLKTDNSRVRERRSTVRRAEQRRAPSTKAATKDQRRRRIDC